MNFEQHYTQEWNSVPNSGTGSKSVEGCFDCNICFDFAHEPIVTLCGHLYCWPCIYTWVHVQSASLASDEHPQCPVCKADISHTTMVPLYGRGQSESEVKRKMPYQARAIPPRPTAFGAQVLASNTPSSGQQLAYQNPYLNQNPFSGSDEAASPSPLITLGGSSATTFDQPSFGIFGETVYARVFGNSRNIYADPNSYYLLGGSSPRLRRQEMQANKSLHRVSIFFFCSLLLCLLVF